jgi:membrane protein DedA with SNARE-associated domain
MFVPPYLDSIIQYISTHNSPVGLGILGVSAAIEYVFPPFPGDTITLFGAFLVTARGWSFALVFAAVLAGSGVGAMADFYFGRWFGRRESRWLGRGAQAREAIDRLVAGFRRHGEVYLVINRFLPGIRSLFFVAAGMARMRPSRVLLWALVSATLWNLLIITAGALLGANWDRIQAFARTYSRGVSVLVALVVVVVVARWWVRRRRERRRDSADGR